MTITNNLIRICAARQKLYRALIAKNICQPSTTNIRVPNHIINLSEADTLGLAAMQPEPFGHTSEKLIANRLNLLPRLAHDHDARTPDGRRVEIKCSRYQIMHWKQKINTTYELKYSWTRVNSLPDSGFDLLLLALLTYRGFDIRVLDKRQVLELAQKITRTRKLGIPSKITIWWDDIDVPSTLNYKPTKGGLQFK